MAALEVVTASRTADQEGRFYFLRYERSSDVEEIDDSSVSYVSAFAVL
jgi:predicted class III extradiol MEMO1 family dioxygenase